MKASPCSSDLHTAVNGGADFMHHNDEDYDRCHDGSISIKVNMNH